MKNASDHWHKHTRTKSKHTSANRCWHEARTCIHTHTDSPIGIRDRAETKELMFARKIFSSNGDLRRLSAVYFFPLHRTVCCCCCCCCLATDTQRTIRQQVRNKVFEIFSFLCASLFVSWAHSSYSLYRHLFVVDIFLYWHISLSVSQRNFYFVFLLRVRCWLQKESQRGENKRLKRKNDCTVQLWAVSLLLRSPHGEQFNEIVATTTTTTTTTTAECARCLREVVTSAATFARLLHLQCTM